MHILKGLPGRFSRGASSCPACTYCICVLGWSTEPQAQSMRQSCWQGSRSNSDSFDMMLSLYSNRNSRPSFFIFLPPTTPRQICTMLGNCLVLTVSGFLNRGQQLLEQVIETQKERAAQFDDESDLIDAYVACGGNADKSGCVSADMLIKIIKHDFGLTIDIEELIRAIDTDGSGEIEFEEFKTLLS